MTTPPPQETIEQHAETGDLDVCPLCDGNGSVPSHHARQMVGDGRLKIEPCYRCKGSGIISVPHP